MLCLYRLYSSSLSLVALLLVTEFAGCCPIRMGVPASGTLWTTTGIAGAGALVLCWPRAQSRRRALIAGPQALLFSERISEHKGDLSLQYFDKLAVVQHALEINHHIGFNEVRLIDRATNYWDHIRREAIEIKLQPNNFNRDSGLHISKAWGPAISALQRLQAHGQHSISAPAPAMPVVGHSVPDVGNAHSDWTTAGKLSDQ